tara:strand:- start:13012 stop:13164 length:153 start_codon:yes stop_codon:yes gene_type:complete
MKYKQAPFWERSINPITGWRVEKGNSYIANVKKVEYERMVKSLKSYGNNK